MGYNNNHNVLGAEESGDLRWDWRGVITELSDILRQDSGIPD